MGAPKARINTKDNAPVVVARTVDYVPKKIPKAEPLPTPKQNNQYEARSASVSV